MMFGFGWIIMLFVLGLPILLIVALVAGAVKLFDRRPPAAYVPPTAATAPAPASASAARYCAHCGQGLQAGWSHCPSCGAPIAVQ